MNIQSLTIPSYNTVTTPTRHIAYNIHVATPTTAYVKSHRYSDFQHLATALAAQIGSPPPGKLPSPRAGASMWSLIGMKKDLTEVELVERRFGLEQWLRGLLVHKDPRWSTCSAFTQFLAPTEKTTEGSATTRPTEFTSATWLAAHQELVELSKGITTTLAERNQLVVQGDAKSHAVAAKARQELLTLVIQLEGLIKGLAHLGQQGMVEGELQRRRKMVGRVQDEIDKLGQLLNPKSVPTMTSRSTPTAEPASAQRQALFTGGRAPSRVLGAATPAVGAETAQTRALDNASLLQLQQTYVTQQDDKLDSLTAMLRRQRQLGLMIGKELEEQGELIDTIDADVDRVGSKLKNAQKQVKRLK